MVGISGFHCIFDIQAKLFRIFLGAQATTPGNKSDTSGPGQGPSIATNKTTPAHITSNQGI